MGRPWASLARTALKAKSQAADLGIMDRNARLLRWAELLRRDPSRQFQLLAPTWCLSKADWTALDCSASALRIACDDPVLRIAGLRGCAMGDAREFFALSCEELDRVLAESWKEQTRSASRTAVCIENIVDPMAQRLLFGGAMLFAAIIVGLSQWLI